MSGTPDAGKTMGGFRPQPTDSRLLMAACIKDIHVLFDLFTIAWHRREPFVSLARGQQLPVS